MNFYEMLILVLFCALFYVYLSIKKSHSFFKRNGIPYFKPNLLFGNMADVVLLRKCRSEVFLDIYRKLDPYKFGGAYFMKKPFIVIRDPELVKDVLIKDFAYFHDRDINVNAELEPLRNHLFSMKGREWKNLRTTLTRAFATGKIKSMFPLMTQCGEKLNTIIDQIPSDESFDIKDLTCRYATDTMGTCAFGLEANSLDDLHSVFRMTSKNTIRLRYGLLLRYLCPIAIPPKVIKLFHSFTGDNLLNFFMNIIGKAVTYREKEKIKRYDFLDLLIALRNKAPSSTNKDSEEILKENSHKHVRSDIEMNDKTMAAQCFLFFTAGSEIPSLTLTYCMFELSQHAKIQNKVRTEIRTVIEKNERKLTYEVINQMTYTDMVISETLRKYPPVGLLLRECTENYQIRDTKVIIPRKTSIIIPVYALHSDERYYDNPEEFRPERFTLEEKSNRPNYTYLPFGEGPRACLAERFAILQVKVGLIFLLKDFSYRLSPKTELPIEFAIDFTQLIVKNVIWLHREKII